MKLLAIDHGLKRIGLAVSDESGLVARELAVITRKSNREDFEQINRIAAEQRVTGIVVGVPERDEVETDGTTPADRIRRWIDRFAQTTTLPIVTWDENLTSVDARELSIRKGRKARDPIDDLAARVILQSYLDAAQDGISEFPNVSPN